MAVLQIRQTTTECVRVCVFDRGYVRLRVCARSHKPVESITHQHHHAHEETHGDLRLAPATPRPPIGRQHSPLPLRHITRMAELGAGIPHARWLRERPTGAAELMSIRWRYRSVAP